MFRLNDATIATGKSVGNCTVHFEHTNFGDIDSREIIASYTGLQIAWKITFYTNPNDGITQNSIMYTQSWNFISKLSIIKRI